MYLESSTKVGAYFSFQAPYHTSTHPFLSAGQYHSHPRLCEKELKHPRLRFIRSANLTSQTGQYEVQEHVVSQKTPSPGLGVAKNIQWRKSCCSCLIVVAGPTRVLGTVAFHLSHMLIVAPDSPGSCFWAHSKLSSLAFKC